MGVDMTTYLQEEDAKIVQKIADERDWSVSKTIANLVTASPEFKAAQKPKPKREVVSK